MPRFARLALAAVSLTLSLACQGDRTTTDVGGPSALISDAAHNAGNPDFFFMPPMVPNPDGSADFEAGEFNASVLPAVQICEGTTATGTACNGTEVALFTGAAVRLVAAEEQYVVNWHTDEFILDPASTYRIRVLSGTTVLGFADVELGATRAELKNVNTGEYIPLLDGRTLPIKFRIENAALCDPPGSEPCSSRTIVLSQGGSVELETGDRVDIPPQASGQVVTVTLQYCDGIDVDLPTFGNCLEVTADPPLALPLFPRAVVSLCTLLASGPALSEAQEDLLVLHRQNNGDVFALPNAPDACVARIGRAEPEPRNFAEAAWRGVRRAVAAAFRPRPLYAATAMLDVGGGGETEDFSRFQFALPAQMEPLPGTDGQAALPGSAVPNAPGVLVTDRSGVPVAGATVHFEVTQGGGTITPLEVLSNALGIARVTSWTLGEAGQNGARASGRGIAGPADGGPFQPRDHDPETQEHLPPGQQQAVVVGTGSVEFTAEGLRVGALRFGQQPTNTQSGDAIAPPLQIEVLDADGNLLTEFVRVVVGNAPGNPPECFINQVTELSVEGIATFSNVLVNGTCAGARLAATAGGAGYTFPIVLSDPFDITAPVGLLLRYSFEGNADNTGLLGGHDGTATSVTYPAGKFGQAIRFDGTTATGATLTGTNAVFGTGSTWTISLWFREDAPPKTESLLWRFRGFTEGWETYHGVSATLVTTCSDGGCFSFSPTVGEWHNIIYRYAAPSATVGAPVDIYVDGVFAGRLENTAAIPLVGSGVTDIRLGNGSGLLGPSLFYVDEFRVYNQVFTVAEQCSTVIGGTWNGEGCILP